MIISIKIDPDALPDVYQLLQNAGIKVLRGSRTVGSNEFQLEIENPADEAQIRNIVKQAILAYRLQGADDFDPYKLRNLTKAQLITYIDNNVTDLPTAKAFLKKLSSMILYLYKRIENHG